MTKAEEILRKEITLFEWGKKNDKKLITYEDALKAVNKAINYTHSCESDSEQLKCNHTWIINHHQGSRYCSKGCDNFEKHTFYDDPTIELRRACILHSPGFA